jgi:hypothetical protein
MWDYRIEKSEIQKLRNSFQNQYTQTTDSILQQQILDSAKETFTSILLNRIIPYWYGTEWDFNGYTATPNQGKIACGYFVSTTLKDAGINLNRFKLGQQNPLNEAKSIAIKIENVRKIASKDIHSEIKKLKNGLYFIGLDNHVGFLYVHNYIGYFIHSNYKENKVMIELTYTSTAFNSSTYYLSEITSNEKLIQNWINNKEIHVYR